MLKEQPLHGNRRLGIDILEREMIGATIPSSNFEHLLGYRLYEGTNHLGNVLTTFSDFKIPRESTTTGITGYYNTDVRNMID